MGFFIGGKWNSPRPTEDFSDFYNPNLGIGEFEFIKPPIDGFEESLTNIFYPTETEYRKQFLMTHNIHDMILMGFVDEFIKNIKIDNKNGYMYVLELPLTANGSRLNYIRRSTAEWLTNPDKFPLSTRMIYEGKYLILRGLPLIRLIVDIADFDAVTREYGDVFKIQTYDKGYVMTNGVYFIPAFSSFCTIAKYIGRSGKTLGNLDIIFNKKPKLNILNWNNHFNLTAQDSKTNGMVSAHAVNVDLAEYYDTDITIRGRLLAE